MKGLESIISKNTKKSFQGYSNNSELNISKIKNIGIETSNSIKKEKMSIASNSSIKNKNSFFNYNNKKINIKLSSRKRTSNFNLFRNATTVIDKDNIYSKRHSQEIFQTKTEKFFQKYDLKEDKDNYFKKKSIISNKYFNIEKLEENIKNAINNMKKDIEKKNKLNKYIRKTKSNSPDIVKKKLLSSPNLKILFI